MKPRLLLPCLSLLLLLFGCSQPRPQLGSAENPIKVFFTPSVEAKTLQDESERIRKHLEKVTPYKYKVGIPASYVAVVEAFGTKRADVAFLNTFGYLLANQRYGAKAKLTVIRHGEATYRSQLVVRADSALKTLDDLQGKRIAFVDPVSASGFLLPNKLLHDRGVKPGETVFAQKHDNVITMVYQGQVDAGATFYSPPHKGEIQDARRLVKPQFPDVEQRIRILELSADIPNDPVVFRKDIDSDLQQEIVKALLAYIHTPEGLKAFEAIYAVSDFRPAKDADYDPVREMLRLVGKNPQDLLKK